MFVYNPTVDNQSGAILAQGQLGAAQAHAAMMQQLGRDISKPIRQAGQAVAGFAMGGPAGAAMAVRGGNEEGGGGDGLIGSIISSFANKKALDAKDQAYTSFFSKHGKDLGFDPSYLEDLKAMSRDDRLTSYELMTGAPGQRLGSLAYMNNQANLFSGNRGSGTGAGGGGGASAPAATGGSSFTF